MERKDLSGRTARRALRALVGVVALGALACDGSVNVTGPSWPEPSEWSWSEPGTRSLQISGSLETQDGACLEATVLYDGVELAGARSGCAEASGCALLQLNGSASSKSGRHTISFKVLRQSQATLDYVARGSVLVSREGLGLGGVAIPFGPKRARLGEGDALTFDVEFVN